MALDGRCRRRFWCSDGLSSVRFGFWDSGRNWRGAGFGCMSELVVGSKWYELLGCKEGIWQREGSKGVVICFLDRGLCIAEALSGFGVMCSWGYFRWYEYLSDIASLGYWLNFGFWVLDLVRRRNNAKVDFLFGRARCLSLSCCESKEEKIIKTRKRVQT